MTGITLIITKNTSLNDSPRLITEYEVSCF